MDKNLPKYMISVASELLGLHPQTLRQYERLGLVIPTRVDGKNRLYSENDIEKAIRMWKGGTSYTLASTEKYYKKVKEEI